MLLRATIAFCQKQREVTRQLLKEEVVKMSLYRSSVAVCCRTCSVLCVDGPSLLACLPFQSQPEGTFPTEAPRQGAALPMGSARERSILQDHAYS